MPGDPVECVLISQFFPNKVPQIGGLKTAQIYSVTVWKSGQESRCQQSWFLIEAQWEDRFQSRLPASHGCWQPPGTAGPVETLLQSLPSTLLGISPCATPGVSEASHVGIGPTLFCYDLISTNYIRHHIISK